MKRVMQIVGAIVLLMGLLWAGQGAGIIMWPASSFMLAQSEWTIYGGITAVVGAVLIWLGSRR